METNSDESVRRRLEEELDIKIYPGTEIMRDVGSHNFIKSSANADAVLVPQPSPSPHDPLNWNRWWKFGVISITTAMSFSQALAPQAVAPIYPQLMETFNASLPQVVQFAGVGILVLGFSNFFWVPLMMSYGRRPVLLASTALCMAANAWRALATSYNSFLGACILNGFAAGPAETALPQIITDTMFLHQRGAYQTLYFSFYFGGLMVGPIVSGPMAQQVGWRSFFWLNTGLLCTILLLLLLFCPETNWNRTCVSDTEQSIAAPARSTDTTDTDGPDKPEVVELEEHIEVASPEKATTVGNTADADSWLGKGYPSKKQFKLWHRDNNVGFRSLLIYVLTPLELLIYPIPCIASFVLSWTSNSMLILLLTQSQAFAGPPYNLGSRTIGLFNVAILIGTFIGLATNGPFSDWVCMKATKRNRGIREPEMRLPAMIPYLVIYIIGNFVVAFGYQYKWSWKIIVIIGYGCAGIQVATLPSIISTYAVDSYKPVAGMLFVTITINKNLWAYGLTKFITRWSEDSGFVIPIMMNMAMALFFCSLTIVFYFKGKTFRKWTANSKVHRM
ncbi:hypothetical protein ASPSYDRAFT_95125 [Aspergillus sydowii CBS 593.65]|uniref:Major facilitator superfamily (MFS) profile domain-containing protein n=1 Tax=Aspergillus sydowii CBS 593.65 TaxID=1036612 RepID=A0A1L9T023_9EURO|nr:uncharacterized protein ASPSYDRAFT_95125 [Aspergillus sydowii CBS 593.65]OJJ52757.1 hypothetical protein ASPSYDRAFT_95125 [Aspergillus sydowii CBS 593.65]